MIKLAYLMGYSKVAVSIPGMLDDLPAAEDALKSIKLAKLLSKSVQYGGDVIDTLYDVDRLKKARHLIEEKKLDKESEFQPMDMPPSGEPDYMEDVPNSNILLGTKRDPKYAKRQAPANQKGTQYE
jgi:hypothetical protein